MTFDKCLSGNQEIYFEFYQEVTELVLSFSESYAMKKVVISIDLSGRQA